MGITYEYYCDACHLTFECHVSIEERDKQTCCLCDGQTTRSVGCAGFQLKGSGWEKDGYGGVPPTGIKEDEV
jgi:putative FmdB family regulatory protein